MLGALALGTTEITNFLEGADCLSTIGCFQSMGIQIDRTPEKIIVHGKGMHGLAAPKDILNVGNSGTTTRLMSGILSAQDFTSVMSGIFELPANGSCYYTSHSDGSTYHKCKR